MADDPWADFSPKALAPDDPWKDFVKSPKEPVSTGEDVAKSAGVGLAKGAIGFAGALGDLPDIGASVAEKVGANPELGRAIASGLNPLGPLTSKLMPKSGDIQKAIEGYTGDFYKPQTTPGEYAQSIGEFAGNPASYVGPGGTGAKILGAVAGGAGSEGLGELAQKYAPALETPARIVGGVLSGFRRGPKAPKEIAPEPPLGVTLSKGQTTGDLATIQAEQAAVRGQLGTPAQERATQFGQQQQEQVGAAKEDIARQFDPYDTPQSRGSIAAETPQDAGALVSQGIQSAAGRAKAGVTQAYDTARGLGGEINAGVFEGIGQKIKGDLTYGDNPVIVNDRLTPHADAMLNDLEENAAKLKIPNTADPLGAPAQADIKGVSLNGVDQIRKRLSSFRQSAYGSGNASDGRAAKAILDAFDDHIDQAVNSGAFTGDPRAVEAWNNARAAHADYKSTFGGQKNDPVGNVIQKILGKGVADPEIPEKVADHLYGASGISPNTTNVGVANRVKSILGEQSPEWTAVKQGLFSRLTENQGLTEWGAQKTGNRLNDFLNGRGQSMAKAVFSPQERDLLQRFVGLQEKLIIPPKGANWSNTAAGTLPMLKRIVQGIAASTGAAIGHAVMPGAGEFIGAVTGYGVSRAAEAVGDLRRLKPISNQMPLVGESIKDWQRAANNATISSGAAAKALLVNTANALARNLNRIGVAVSAAELQNIPQAALPSPAQLPQQQKHGGKTLEKLERSRKRLQNIQA